MRHGPIKSPPDYDDEDEELATVEAKLGQFLKQPRYLEHTKYQLLPPSPSYHTSQHAKLGLPGGYTERDGSQPGQFGHLGLEIQGKEVHIEDPEVAKQKLQRRHEELRRIDKQSQELQEKMLSSQKLNQDLGK